MPVFPNVKPLLCAAIIVLIPAQAAWADAQSGILAWQNGDYGAAVEAWRSAAQSGDADAQYNLAQAYRLGRGVPMDMAEAESWYRRAAVQGHIRAEDNLGLILFQKRAYPQAFALLEKSAARGDPRAQYVLGTALFNGDLIKRDWTRAYALMLRASANGLGRATEQLREMNKYVQPYVKEQAQSLAEKLAAQEAPQAESASSAPVAAEEPASSRSAEAAPNPAPNPGPNPAPNPGPNPAPNPAPMPVDTASAPAPRPMAEPAAGKPAQRRTIAAPTLMKAWSVQLGAFSEQANAAAFLRTGKSRQPSLSPYRLSTRAHGRLTAVLAGPIPTRHQAEQLCTLLRKKGQACVIIAP